MAYFLYYSLSTCYHSFFFQQPNSGYLLILVIFLENCVHISLFALPRFPLLVLFSSVGYLSLDWPEHFWPNHKSGVVLKLWLGWLVLTKDNGLNEQLDRPMAGNDQDSECKRKWGSMTGHSKALGRPTGWTEYRAIGGVVGSSWQLEEGLPFIPIVTASYRLCSKVCIVCVSVCVCSLETFFN